MSLSYREYEHVSNKKLVFDIDYKSLGLHFDGDQGQKYSGFSFLHKVISRSDPLYFDPGAVQARIDEWTKLLEFHCFEENSVGEVNIYEKADLVAQGFTVVKPVMVTSIKNYGTFEAMFKARLAADGRTVERDMSYSVLRWIY